jgi:hypothetical protein
MDSGTNFMAKSQYVKIQFKLGNFRAHLATMVWHLVPWIAALCQICWSHKPNRKEHKMWWREDWIAQIGAEENGTNSREIGSENGAGKLMTEKWKRERQIWMAKRQNHWGKERNARAWN